MAIISGTYKTTILRAGDVKALAQNIGRSYSGSEKAAKSRTCIGIYASHKHYTDETINSKQNGKNEKPRSLSMVDHHLLHC